MRGHVVFEVKVVTRGIEDADGSSHFGRNFKQWLQMVLEDAMLLRSAALRIGQIHRAKGTCKRKIGRDVSANSGTGAAGGMTPHRCHFTNPWLCGHRQQPSYSTHFANAISRGFIYIF